MTAPTEIVRPTVGAVRGREGRAAVCLMHRSACFAADDRSYGVAWAYVGAVCGREGRASVCLIHRGACFAADDRSYGVARAYELTP